MGMYGSILFRQRVRHGGDSVLCCLAAMKMRLTILEDNILEIVLTGQMLGAPAPDGIQKRLAVNQHPLLKFLVPGGILPQTPPTLSISGQGERRHPEKMPGIQAGSMPTSLDLVRRTRRLRRSSETAAAAYELRPLQCRESFSSSALTGNPTLGAAPAAAAAATSVAAEQ